MKHNIYRGRYLLTVGNEEPVPAEVEHVSPRNGRVVVRVLTRWEPRYDIPARNVSAYTWQRV
jgi:hypothetical protein